MIYNYGSRLFAKKTEKKDRDLFGAFFSYRTISNNKLQDLLDFSSSDVPHKVSQILGRNELRHPWNSIFPGTWAEHG